MLYNVSVAASNAQLGGQGITNGTLVVEIQGTNYTGLCMNKNNLKSYAVYFDFIVINKFYYTKLSSDDI